MAKTITVISESQAKRLWAQTGMQLGRMKHCTGKYATLPSEAVGNDVRVSDDVVAVYPVRRRDRDGPYTQMMCLVNPLGGK